MSLTKLFGSLKHDMVYVGITCITALIRISWPTWESNFSFHPFNFFQILSFIKLKDFFLSRPTREGSLKYCSYYCRAGTPMKFKMVALVLYKVFKLFTLWPEACSYKWSIDWIWTHSDIAAWQNTRLSSINRRWEIWGPATQRETPLVTHHLHLS